MSFTRSPSALYGIHRFFQVDIVVFCEGGKSLTYADATSYNAKAINTLDTLYWSAIANRLETGKSYHFKSVGCKVTINAIGEEVHRLGLNSITVCRDSDYDRVLGRHPAVERIGWTMGYSWESDVVKPLVLENLIISILGDGPDGSSAIKGIRAKTARFERDLQRWVEIDISLCFRKSAGIFERDKPLSTIDMTAPPSLRCGHLINRLASAGYKRKPKRVIAVSVNEVTTRCFGKLISKALYHTFLNEVQQFASVRIDYELFMRMAINETIRLEQIGLIPNLTAHISNQRAAFL